MQVILGILAVIAGGLISGSGAWPMKLMRRYEFEHWWFVAMMAGLIVFPWIVVVGFCPNLGAVVKTIPWATLRVANAWAAGWGVANVLCGLCFVRLGVALTTAILGGMGICLGVLVPLVFKGSGVFQQSPAFSSSAGLVISLGALVALGAVFLAATAGRGRERAKSEPWNPKGSFGTSLLLVLTAGVLCCGCTFSFIYGQAPILSALKAQAAGAVAASFAVWAFALAGGALVSVGYAAWLLTRNRSWGVLLESPREFGLSVVIGLNVVVSIALLGSGMLLMGPLGGSIGSGVQQIMWILGGQAVGFFSGEWRGVPQHLKRRMWLAMLVLALAALLLCCGNLFARG